MEATRRAAIALATLIGLTITNCSDDNDNDVTVDDSGADAIVDATADQQAGKRDAGVDLAGPDASSPDANSPEDAGADASSPNVPSEPWVFSAGGTADDSAYSIVADAEGNSYVAGAFEGAMTLGQTTLQTAGEGDAFVVKLDPNGNPVWAVSGGGAGWDGAFVIRQDLAGNLYLLGEIGAAATFGGESVGWAGESDVFVAKLDPAGKFLWAASGGGADLDMLEDMAVDGSGNVVITGRHYGASTFGSTVLQAVDPGVDLFVAKLDSSGKFVWAITFVGTSYTDTASANGITTDNAGNIYLAGHLHGTIAFGDKTLTAQGTTDVFVVKLDADGNLVWVIQSGGDQGDGAWAIESDGSNTFLAGNFSAKATFGAETLVSTTTGIQAFVAKLDPQGNYLWATATSGDGNAHGEKIAVDGAGNSYVCGGLSGDKLFGSHNLSKQGNRDLFVAKLDAKGSFVWATSAAPGGSTSYIDGRAVAVDGAGNLFVADWFADTATIGSSALVSEGGTDLFAWKIGPPGVQ